MIKEIDLLQNLVFEKVQLLLKNLEKDAECEEYFGYNFHLNQFKIKFRKAKITPKKTGQFVTIWKRNLNRKTEPFKNTDDFDFYIIFTEQKKNSGFFIFPKNILSKRNILSTQSKEGKRGFRLYPNWDFPENKQAQKAKIWQTEFFINFTKNEEADLGKFETIWKEII